MPLRLRTSQLHERRTTGAYKNGTKGQKIDYVFLSPALFASVTGGRASFGGASGAESTGPSRPHYPTMTDAVRAASDHAAIYADIAL